MQRKTSLTHSCDQCHVKKHNLTDFCTNICCSPCLRGRQEDHKAANHRRARETLPIRTEQIRLTAACGGPRLRTAIHWTLMAGSHICPNTHKGPPVQAQVNRSGSNRSCCPCAPNCTRPRVAPTVVVMLLVLTADSSPARENIG